MVSALWPIRSKHRLRKATDPEEEQLRHRVCEERLSKTKYSGTERRGWALVGQVAVWRGVHIRAPRLSSSTGWIWILGTSVEEGVQNQDVVLGDQVNMGRRPSSFGSGITDGEHALREAKTGAERDVLDSSSSSSLSGGVRTRQWS